MTELLIAFWLLGFAIFLWALLDDTPDWLTVKEYAATIVVCAAWPVIAVLSILGLIVTILLFKGGDE